MAIKKSDLYSSLWASCDELRGGMDASQYKDYVLFMLFIKYVSDKYGDTDDFAPPVTIPPGASFKDMIALKGKSDLGDRINKEVIQPLVENNARLARTDFPDFNDPNKLGEGQAMVDRLTNLIAIFQKPELDFSKNCADNDDILGDAYEYLMRHFATEKAVKNVHLSVHPPDGRVTLVTPSATRLEVARAYAVSKLGWIRRQQRTLAAQARETPRRFVRRESHHVWGRRYLLNVVEQDARPSVTLDHRRITLSVRPGSDQESRQRTMHRWHKDLLHAAIPPLLEKWSSRLGVTVAGYFLQRMKTRWGSCNHEAKHVRFNTELVKKPKDLLEYVVVHELVHLLEPTHSERFVAILQAHYPNWREARVELNELPLASEESWAAWDGG